MKQQNIITLEVYNLLMKKQSESYIQQLQTKPARTQSPDFKAANSIRATRSPENIEYILNENQRKKLSVSAWETPTKKEPQTGVSSRYFVNNRSTISNNKLPVNTTNSDSHGKNSYCHTCCSGHCHCVHATNNEEVVIELRKIITMINGAAVSSFTNEGQDQSKQIDILRSENDRLLALVERYKSKAQSKIEPGHHYENQIKILRQQLSHNLAEHEKQRQQLYRTSKTISSQYKSLEDKYLNYQKELQKLRHQLKMKQEQLQNAQESRKRGQEKLSLSIIKDQYNSSVKSLKSSIQYDVNNQLNDYEAEIRDYHVRLGTLEQRLKNCEKVNDINKKLNEENKNLRKSLSEKDSKIQTLPDSDRILKQNQELHDHIKLLNKQVGDLKSYYENQIADLRDKSNANEQRIGKDTEARLKKLMQNYEQQIKILKNELKSKACNHKGIEEQNQKLRQQNEDNWQEVIKLRNELVKYTADNTKMDNELKDRRSQINKLNNQISNLIGRIGLLENDNAALIKDAEDKLAISRSLAMFEDENEKLRQDLILKQSNITNITALQNENRQLKNELERSRLNHQQLQDQNNRMFDEIDRVTNESSKRQLQLRQTYKKQYDDTKALYEDQIHQIQEENKRIYDECDALKIENSKLQFQIKNMEQYALKQKNDKIYEHEMTIRNLGKIIEETQDKISRLQDNIRQRNKENERLILEINHIKDTYQKNARESTEHWQNEIEAIMQAHQNEVDKLKSQLAQRQSEEQAKLSQLRSKISTFSTESLKKELLELKKLVDEARFQKLEQELAKISQGFERELIRSQQKTLEIDGLTKDKCALEDRIGDLERMRLILEQKINILDGNVKILQNELKEKKYLCDSLMNQKLILEKQNLMLKKIKLDKESIEATKAKAREISHKIDRLLAMQEERQNNYMDVSKTYSQMMIESKAKKI